MTALETARARADRLNEDFAYALALGDGHLIEVAARQYADARELVGVEMGAEAALRGMTEALDGTAPVEIDCTEVRA